MPHALRTLWLTCSRASRASCPTESCLTCVVPYVLSCTTCLVLHYVSRALYAFVPYVPLVLHVLVSHVPPTLRTLVPHVLCALRTWFLTWPCVSRFMSSFSLRTLLPRTLRTLCVNISLCALQFPCLRLLFFCSFATGDFLG